MGSGRRTAAVLAAALLGASLAASPAAADAVADQVAELEALEKAGDSTKCAARIAAIKDWSDPRVAAEVRDLAKSANDAIACAAIRALAARKDAKALEWLRARAGDKDLARAADKGGRPDVYRCVLDALLPYRDPGTLKPLEDAVKTYMTTDSDYAARAIRAYGCVREKSVIDQLIAWLADLDEHHGGKSSGGSGGHGRYSPEGQRIRDASMAVLVQTLADATDQDLPDAVAWRKWWTEHAKTFVFPKPDAQDDADVTTLTEWTDRRYGYTLKRPAGEGWAFRPGDDQFRISVLETGAGGEWRAMAAWNVYRSIGSNIKDVKGFADWWMTKQFPEKEFEKYSAGGEPSAAARTFAGRDWTVVTARGMAKGSMANWGVMERRVYITRIDCGYLYAWAVVKTTIPDEEKQRTWDVVEKAVFAAK
jgi:hypothetical protein